MRFQLFIWSIFLLACLIIAAIQGWLGELSTTTVGRLEQAGYFALGWGAGVTGWLLTGHQTTSCLLKKVPNTWKLWQRDILVSLVPAFKYLTAGVLFAGLGILLGYALSGLFIQAFDTGLLIGAIFGLVHSLRKGYTSGPDRINFFEANQRYLNEKKVPLFSDEWK